MALRGGGWRDPGFGAALISVPLLADLLTAHATSQLGLTGLCLAAWAQPPRRWVLMGVGLAIGLIRPPNALPLVAVPLFSSVAQPLGLVNAVLPRAPVTLPPAALALFRPP